MSGRSSSKKKKSSSTAEGSSPRRQASTGSSSKKKKSTSSSRTSSTVSNGIGSRTRSSSRRRSVRETEEDDSSSSRSRKLAPKELLLSAENGGAAASNGGLSSSGSGVDGVIPPPTAAVEPSPRSVASAASASRRVRDAHDDVSVKEFGGAWGVTAIAVIFPLLMLYFWSCLEFHEGQFYFPKDFTSLASWREFGELYVSHIRAKAIPTLYSAQIYIGYVVFSALLAFIMPGVTVKGMPVPSLNYQQLVYKCNGYSSFYFTVFLSLVLNHFKIFPLRHIVENFGELLMTAILTGWIMSFAAYFLALLLGTGHRLSGNHVYDFFMGAPLNPRVGVLDLKMWSEIRVPWIILFYVSLSAVTKVWEDNGADYAAIWMVPAGLWFTLLGHWLYVNACMKGEDCIPATWDIFYEKWGFMLIFWNMAGVPFTYCYNTLYLLKRVEAGNTLYLSWWANGTLCVVLLAAYYVWDCAQAQKSHFRQQQANATFIHRWTFPQLPGAFLDNPSFIKTKHGSPLLTAGFWGVARKIHYTADFTMSMCWALVCGFGSPIPYFYPFFFLCVLVHRVTRDMERCATKYGDDWVRYCKQVPYIFIPGVL